MSAPSGSIVSGAKTQASRQPSSRKVVSFVVDQPASKAPSEAAVEGAGAGAGAGSGMEKDSKGSRRNSAGSITKKESGSSEGKRRFFIMRKGKGSNSSTAGSTTGATSSDKSVTPKKSKSKKVFDAFALKIGIKRDPLKEQQRLEEKFIKESLSTM